jgi:hypothetical protein
MRKILMILALAASAAWAQQRLTPDKDPTLPRYQVNKTTSLSSAAEKVTVQATTTSGAVSFEEADIYCSVACTATVQVNGTAATATTLALVGPIGIAAAPTPLPVAFSGSNVGSPTSLKVFNIPAGGTMVVDLHIFYLPAGAGGGANLTIATSSITGTATIQIQMVVGQ